MTSHIDEQRLEDIVKAGGPHLTEEELEHIADCRECGERVFDKVFLLATRFAKPTDHVGMTTTDSAVGPDGVANPGPHVQCFLQFALNANRIHLRVRMWIRLNVLTEPESRDTNLIPCPNPQCHMQHVVTGRVLNVFVINKEGVSTRYDWTNGKD